MTIKINSNVVVKKGFEFFTNKVIKTALTIKLGTNLKRPVTVSYINTCEDGTSYTNNESNYALKKHNDGNYYINANVGYGYKTLKVTINELVKEELK